MSSMGHFHLLGKDNQKEMEHNSFSHLVQLASTSPQGDANGTNNGNTAFV